MDQPGQDGLTDAGHDAFAELKNQGEDDVVLLRLGLAEIEQPRLAVMIGKAFRTDAQLLTFFGRRKRLIAALLALMLDVRPKAGRLVIHLTWRHGHLHVAVPLQVVERAAGLVDRNLVEVGAAQAA